MSATPLNANVEKSSADFKPQGPNDRPNITDLFVPFPKPTNDMGYYRILSPTAGVRVSPISIGGMSIGDQWTSYMKGSLNQQQADEFLDTYHAAGGNFIDTSNNYQDEQSEHIIGEWMEKRGIRNDIVLATKYTTYTKDRASGPYPGIKINYIGNHSKSMKISVEESLRRLRTSYLDILYVHWWDHTTSIPELMQSLNDLVRSGKVLYLGVSDTPAWIVSQANEYARSRGMAQFVIYQGRWNLIMRDIERDILPMCRNNGMALAPYGVLGSGRFKTAKELESRAMRGGDKPSEAELKVVKVLEEVANEIGDDTHLAHVAMAWCRQKFTDCYPILGGTSISQLKSNMKALDIILTPMQMQKLDEASPFNHGFPTGHFGLDPRAQPDLISNSWILNSGGWIKFNGYPKNSA